MGDVATTEAQATEITAELMHDIARALEAVARGFLPVHAHHMKIVIQMAPVALIELRIPEPTGAALEAALHELAGATKRATDEAIPSLPLRYTVIGGSEAAGIIIRPLPAEAPPVYGHIIKARIAWLKPSAWLRKLRPNLPERVVFE